MNRLRNDPLCWVGVSPADWSRGSIVVADIAQQFSPQVSEGAEDPSGDHVALDFGEPVFDLVEPGRVSGRKVETNVGMVGQKGVHELGLMRREIVGNDVDRLARRLRRDHLFEKGHKLRAGVALGRLPQHLSAPGFQRGVQGQGSVAKVFKAVRLGPPRRKRQHRIQSIQGLNRGLFINAKDCGMGRRLQIEANDVGRLGLEVRIIADHVMAQTVRLQPVASPDPGHHHMGGPEFDGQAPTAPVSAAVLRTAAGPFQNTCFQLGRVRRRDAPFMPGCQSAESLVPESSGPALNIGGATLHMSRRGTYSLTGSQLQNKTGAARILRPNGSRTSPPLKFPTLRWSKNQAFGRHLLQLQPMWPKSMLQCTRSHPHLAPAVAMAASRSGVTRVRLNSAMSSLNTTAIAWGSAVGGGPARLN